MPIAWSSAMYPKKSQCIRATSEARYPRFISAALIAATLSFTASTVSAGETEAKRTEQLPPVPEAPPQSLLRATLLAQAETAHSGKQGTKGPKVNVDQNGVILKGYDPVAYFKQGHAIKGEPKYSSTYDGAIYYFASAADKRDFDKNPAKYKPQYGGYCANGMSKGKLADIDPNQFFIYKGKLYVCTGPREMKNFQAKPDTNIKKADKNWKIYQPPSIPGYLGRVFKVNPKMAISACGFSESAKSA
jgi:YHS domain-containing protein